MKTKSIRISEGQEQYLLSKYKNVNQGIQECIHKDQYPDKNVETFKYIREHSKRELVGKFTEAEWFFFFDSLNGTLTDSRYRCNPGHLIFHSEDSEFHDGTASKYHIEINDLVPKIKKLTAAQVEALYCHVEEFWDAPHESRNLEEWAKKML